MSALPPDLRAVSATEVAERLLSQRRAVPHLLFRDGDGRQHVHTLLPGSGPLCIGRGPASDIALPWDHEVSRAHAQLEQVGDAWTLVDDGLSHNGSFVNGSRVHSRQRLRDGDTISVGRTLIAFIADGQARFQSTETTRVSPRPVVSAAQQRVLEALCRPYRDVPFAGPASNREIAGELFLSIETVKTHLRALFDLFGVATLPQNRKRAELVRRAIESGVVVL
jgi:hypothetical protein